MAGIANFSGEGPDAAIMTNVPQNLPPTFEAQPQVEGIASSTFKAPIVSGEVPAEPTLVDHIIAKVHPEWPKFVILTVVMLLLLGGFILLFYFLNKKGVGIFKNYTPKPGTSLVFVNALSNPSELPPTLSAEQQKTVTAVLTSGATQLTEAETSQGGIGGTILGYPSTAPTITTCSNLSVPLSDPSSGVTTTKPCGNGTSSAALPNNPQNNPSIS